MKLCLIILLFLLLGNASSSMFKMERGSALKLVCPGDEQDDLEYESNISHVNISRGKPGKRGPQGPPGPPGAKEPDSEIRRRYEDRILALETQLRAQNDQIGGLGQIGNPAESCKAIKLANDNAENGLYYIRDNEGNVFQTYCDMDINGGGWTLVASVHENNMKGRCTSGDRWSSEQGNSAQHPHGDGFWENRAVHGSASSSTSDDYKNSGYFAMNARDIMLWHTPNDTPVGSFDSEAFIKYHTSNGFLQRYGGNLQTLYSKHYPMRSKQYTANKDNGPSIPITWDKGSNAKMVELTPINSRGETESGYVQFRAVNNERNAFALCPGVRIKPNKRNVEHVCIGSTSYNIGHTREEEYCGDFAAKDWSHSSGWSAPEKIITSVVMIFYR
uniref:intelectin-1-like n=1 Tax=Styela clava TaxID=7725 RepID=UPI00193955B7|nr:intelectin-1-like [Styela clava]